MLDYYRGSNLFSTQRIFLFLQYNLNSDIFVSNKLFDLCSIGKRWWPLSRTLSPTIFVLDRTRSADDWQIQISLATLILTKGVARCSLLLLREQGRSSFFLRSKCESGSVSHNSGRFKVNSSIPGAPPHYYKIDHLNFVCKPQFSFRRNCC